MTAPEPPSTPGTPPAEAAPHVPATEPPLSDGILRHVGLVALIAVVGYFSLYALDSHLRARKGPWEVTFAAETNGTPFLLIHQPALGVDAVKVRFVGEQNPLSNGPVTVRFTEPNLKPGFGEVRFQDATYLPGTVTLLAFNHEVELIPRGLALDRQERAWAPGLTVELTPTNAAPPLRPQARKRNY